MDAALSDRSLESILTESDRPPPDGCSGLRLPAGNRRSRACSPARSGGWSRPGQLRAATPQARPRRGQSPVAPRAGLEALLPVVLDDAGVNPADEAGRLHVSASNPASARASCWRPDRGPRFDTRDAGRVPRSKGAPNTAWAFVATAECHVRPRARSEDPLESRSVL